MGAPRIVIVTSTGFPPAWVDQIRREIPGPEYVPVPDRRDEIEAALPGAAALIGLPRWAADLAGQTPGLAWVHAGGAGVEDFVGVRSLVDAPCVLTNGRIIQGPEVADHAMALLLCLTRNLHLALRGRSPLPRPVELLGKTALVVGLGGVGLAIAERAHAFGMRVLGVNLDYVPMVSLVERVLEPEATVEGLRQADVVFLSCPLTPASDGLLGARELEETKRGAWLVNVSRGRTVRTDALVEALRAGRLAGAGLDVTDPEPLPENHPLRAMDNVVLTPHVAGLSEKNRERGFELVKTNLRRFLAGRPLFNVVDKRLGF